VQRDSSKELVDDFIDVAQHRIVDVVGDDTYGRKVIGMLLLFFFIPIIIIIISTKLFGYIYVFP
jgi:hypothetical protein